MASDASPLDILTPVFLGVAYLCLNAVYRCKSRKVKEWGHIALSVFPWLHLALVYTFGFYVRLGFGRWPKCCADNPDLPLIEPLAYAALWGHILIWYFYPLLWLGWLVIRLAQGYRELWITTIGLFVSGMSLVFLLDKIDPWGFWEWLWD